MANTSGAAAPSLVRVEGAGRTFRMGDVEVPALVDVDLTIEAGEFMVILGPSGSGKSTLLNLIGGTDRSTSGHVWYGERDLSRADDKALTGFRREKVGFIQTAVVRNSAPLPWDC